MLRRGHHRSTCATSSTSSHRQLSMAVLALLTFITTMLHLQLVNASCTAGAGWQSYPAMSSTITCPTGSIIVGIQAFAPQWNNLGYNGVPSSYNITCSDGTILSTNNGAGSLDTNWPLVSCPNGFTGMVYRADSALGVLYNIEPQCNGMTTMLLGSYRQSSPSPLTTCNGGDFIGLQTTYNSQLVQCIEPICDATVPVRPISVFEYNSPARGAGKASLLLNGRPLLYGQVFEFGSTTLAIPLTRLFRIRNPGATPIKAFAINATNGYDTSKWSITSSSFTNVASGSFGSGYTIAAGASLSFNVTYTPAAAQADTLQLFVHTNATIYKIWTANMTAHSTMWTVTGNCAADIYIQDRDPAAASPSSCFILPTVTKSYSVQTATNLFSFTNLGVTSFGYTIAIITEGAYAFEFMIIGGNGASDTLESYDVRQYGIQFQPSMGGLREAIVVITTNDASQSSFMFTVRGYGSDQQLQMIGIGTNTDNGDGTQYIQERGSVINWGDVPYGWPKQVSSPAVNVGRTAIKMIQLTNIGSFGDLHVFIPQLNNSNWRVNTSIAGSQANLNFTITPGQTIMIYLNLTSSGHIGYNNDTIQVWADQYMWLSQFPNGYQSNFSVAHTVVELVVSAIRDDYTTAFGSIYNGKLSVYPPDGTAFIGTNYFVGATHLFAMDQFSYDNANVNITSFSLTGPGASQYSITLNIPRPINHGAIAYFAIKYNTVAASLPLPAVVTLVTDLPRGVPTNTYQFGIAGVAMGMRWVSPTSTSMQIPNALFIPVATTSIWYQVQLWIASPNGANSSFAFTCSVSLGVNATQLQFSTSVNSTTTTWLAPSIGYSAIPMQGNLTCTNLVSTDIVYTGAPLPSLPIYIQGRITFDRSSVIIATNSDMIFQLLLSHVTPSELQIAVWSPSQLLSIAPTWTIPAGGKGINITVHATAATTNVIKFSPTSLSFVYNMAAIDDLPFTTIPGCGALNDQPGNNGIVVNNHNMAAIGDIRYLSCHSGYTLISGVQNVTCTSSGWTNYSTSVCSDYAPILLGGGFYMDGIYFKFDRNMSSTAISCQNGLEAQTLYAVQATAQGDTSSPVCYWGNDQRTWIVKWAVSASLVVGETIALKAGVFYSDIDSSHAFSGDSGIPSAPTVGLPSTLNVTIIGPDSTRQQPKIGKCDSYALTALVAGDVAGGRNGLMATYSWSILDADQIPLGLKSQGYSQADCDALGNSVLGAVALANTARDSTSLGTSLIGYPVWSVPASVQTGNFSVTWQLSVTHWTGIKVNTSYTVFVSKLISPNITLSAGINSTAIYGDIWNNTATVSLARPQCTSTLSLTWWTQWSLVAVINGSMPSSNVMKIINSTIGSPSATLSLNTSLLSIGATYVFSVTTQNQTAFLPGLTRLAGNRTVTLTIGTAVVVDPTYTPVVVGARLSNDASMIMISWDVPTDQPFGTVPFGCGALLSAATVTVLGTGALCVWYNTTTLAVMPAPDATYDLTTMFTTQGNTVKSTLGLSSTSISATVPLWLPMIPPVPSITIAGATTQAYCQSMIFTTNVTSGAAGRAILSYAWNVTDVTAGNISLQTGTSASITINQLLLTAERPTRVTITVTNWLSVASITQFWITSTLTGVLPAVSLVGNNTRTIARLDVLQLETSIIYGVCGNPGMSYLWSKVSGPVLQAGGVTLTDSSLIIPTKRFSTVASYVLNFRAWMTSSPSLFVTFNITITVTSSPLIAALTGIATGAELFLSRVNAAPLILNASQSSDPDVADALRHIGLTYTWSCTWLTNGARCFPSGSGADNIVVTTTTPDITIPMSQLSDTTTADAYVFVVSVAKNVRVTNASVIVHVLSAAQLSVTTRVQSLGVVISDGIVAPSLPFEIISTMDHAINQSYTYVWSCKTSTGSVVNLTQLARAGKIRTGLAGPYLAFVGAALSSSVTYQFTVVITRVSTGVTGTSIVSVAMDSGATDGTCTISPSSGDISTVFVASCSNWQANGAAPLSYVWRATSADGSPFQLTTGTSTTIQLAPGVAPLNQRSITTLITNARGTSITIITNLTVTALSANTSANSVINSLSGRLTAAAAASDPAGFSQAYAISTSLLSSLNSTARAALCNSLVAGVLGLANGTVATADSVAQRIALVSQVTSTAASDLSADARASLAKLLVDTTVAALSLGACSPAFATSALTALGDVISAASSTNYSSASVTSEATSLAVAFTSTLSAAARGLVNGQLPGETVIVSTPSVTLQTAQDDPSTMAGSSYSIGGQSFTLPSSLFGQLSSSTPSSVGYSASVQNASLFNYAANGTVSGSSLVSISLFDASSSAGGVLAVSNIPDGIDIIIDHANITVVDSNDVSNTISSDLTLSPPRAVPTCRWFNFAVNTWSTAGCSRISALSTSTRTVCRCTHLTDFNIELGSFHAPTVTPITVQDILNLADLPRHPTAMIWLAGLWALYFMLVPFARRTDEKKHMMREVVPQTKHDPHHWRHPSMKGASRFQRWRAYVRDHFKYDHLWFSVALRRANDNFSSTERLTCVFVVIIGSMAISAAFWSHDQGGRIGTILVGVISSVALMPASAGLRFIFRRAGTDPTGGINHQGAVRKDQFIRVKTARMGGLPSSALANDTNPGDKYKSAAPLPSLPAAAALPDGSVAVEMSTPTGVPRSNQIAPSSPPMSGGARVSPQPSDAAPLLPTGGSRAGSSSSPPPPGSDKGPLAGRGSVTSKKRSLADGELGAIKHGAFGVDKELPREEVKLTGRTSGATTPPAVTMATSPNNNNGATEEKTAMLPAAAAGSTALADPTTITGDNTTMKGTSSSEELFDNHGKKKKTRKRCCCAPPKSLPLYWKNIGWTISVLWALGCSFIILVYGVKFDEFDNGDSVGYSTASRWMLSSLCSNVQAVFVNEPVSILVKASLSVFFGNLILKAVECIADTDLTS